MGIVVVTPRAQGELDDIYYYLAKSNKRASRRLFVTVKQKCHLLADNFMLGRHRPELLPEVRSWVIGQYVLLYRPIENGIELLRVVHGSRDLGGLVF